MVPIYRLIFNKVPSTLTRVGLPILLSAFSQLIVANLRVMSEPKTEEIASREKRRIKTIRITDASQVQKRKNPLSINALLNRRKVKKKPPDDETHEKVNFMKINTPKTERKKTETNSNDNGHVPCI